MVLELFDDQTLHRLVGVKPKNGPGKADANSESVPAINVTQGRRNANAQEARSIQLAWKEADVEPEGDGAHRPNRRRGRGENDEGETGRYDIERLSRKRRKTGGRGFDHHGAVYTSEEDGEEEEGEEREHDLRWDEDKGHSGSKSRGVSPDSRRSFWLSKGIGGGPGSDSS